MLRTLPVYATVLHFSKVIYCKVGYQTNQENDEKFGNGMMKFGNISTTLEDNKMNQNESKFVNILV